MLVMQTLRVADSCVIDAHVLLVLADEWGRVSHPDALSVTQIADFRCIRKCDPVLAPKD